MELTWTIWNHSHVEMFISSFEIMGTMVPGTCFYDAHESSTANSKKQQLNIVKRSRIFQQEKFRQVGECRHLWEFYHNWLTMMFPDHFFWNQIRSPSFPDATGFCRCVQHGAGKRFWTLSFFFDCLTLYSYKAVISIHAKGGRRKDIYIVCITYILYTYMAILLDGNSSWPPVEGDFHSICQAPIFNVPGRRYPVGIWGSWRGVFLWVLDSDHQGGTKPPITS